jgi:membrane protein YqaA with SNARE-associated domain
MDSIFSQTYAWTIQWAKSRFSLLAIFLFLFLDASIFPLPTTVIFITISLIHPSRSFYNALAGVAGMVLGAIAGYTIGHYLWLLPDGNFTPFANYFFNHIPNFTAANYQNAQKLYFTWRYSILFFSIILPIPYQIFSITAGAFNFDLFGFAFSTLIFQGLRFFLLAWLIITHGVRAKIIFRENMKIIALISAIVFLVIIAATKLGIL